MTKILQKCFTKLTDNLGGKEVLSSNDLAKIIFENRSKIRKLVEQNKELKRKYQNGNHTNWYLFFADYREYLGFPRFMDLNLFNSLTEVIMTSGEEINYDEFLKIFKSSIAKSKISNERYNGPDVSKKIKNQGERIAGGLVEVVANAIDAMVPQKTIGRFGEGFYQSLKFLNGNDSELIIQTKKQNEKGFQIHLKNTNGDNLVGSVGIEKQENGTTVKLQKRLTLEEQNSLKAFLIRTFQTNKKVRILLNGKLVNQLEQYNYYNGEGLKLPNLEVHIEINENGFVVLDKGIGMSSKDLSEKLLYPDISGKSRLNSDSMSDEEILENTKKETSFFYKHFKNGNKIKKQNHETKIQKTNIRLQVGGVLIEDFFEQTSYDISEFCLELPSFTWLPKSRNKIELTKEVVVSIQMAIEKISDQITDKKEKVMLLEIIAKIIKHLKSRESSKVSIKSKYDISKVAKTEFKKIKQELEESGKTVIANIPGIQDIIPSSDNIIFIDPEFLSFDVDSIPNIKKLKNISRATKKFYKLNFSPKSNYDYLILDGAIIVNSKYTQTKRDLDKINTQVNLNTGYEQGNDIVFYGLIEDNEEEKGNEKLIKRNTKNALSQSSIDTTLGINITREQAISYVKILSRFTQDFGELIEGWDGNEEGLDFLGAQNDAIFYAIKCDYNDEEVLQAGGIIEDIKNYGENYFRNVFYKIIFGFQLTSLSGFSNTLFEKFYNFAKSNSKEIVDIFRSFTLKIEKVSTPEKYLLQVMDLLNDETNAKYIIKYLREFDDLNRDDIKTLFAYFEGGEVEEEEQHNKYYKLYKEGKDIELSNLLIFDFNAENVEIVGDINGEILFKITNHDWKYSLYYGDKKVLIDGKSEFYDLGVIDINPDGTISGSYHPHKGSLMKMFDDLDLEEAIQKEESEYLKMLKEKGPDFLWKHLNNSLFSGKNDIGCERIYEYNGTIAYIIEMGHPELYSLYIGNTCQEVDGNFIHSYINMFRVINGKIFFELDDGKFYYSGKVYKFIDFVGDGKIEIQDIDKDSGTIAVFCNSDLKFIDLKTFKKYKQEKETKYLDIYNENGGNELLKVILKENPSIKDIDIHTEIDGLDIFYTAQNQNGTESFYIGKQKLEINGKTEFYVITYRFITNGVIKGYYQEAKESPKIRFNFDTNNLLPKVLENKNDITKNYSQKVLSFVEFLCKGGEFLSDQENKVSFESKNNMLLTDIIGISKNFSDEIENITDESSVETLEDLKIKITNKLKNRTPFERMIISTIDGQDRASMIWIREVIQNSRDAVLKARKFGDNKENVADVNIDFYSNNSNWIGRISDNIGMTTYEVFKYLLTPGKSGKENEQGATGMFGQGFYSLSIGAKEIRVKTSIGNGKTTYVKLTPKYNENKDIIDFEINYDVKDEEFCGTIIERVDDSEGVGGNIGALVGLHNMQKYVGNVDDINIKYNGNQIFKKEDIHVLQTEIIPNLGTLTLKQNKDKSERLTKDNLFISEIKDEYLDFLPDFILEYIKKNGYSLDLPHFIGLTDTRNSITDFEENIEILTPHIFNIFSRLIIKDYLDGKVKLPMMPLDYFGLDLYEREFDREILDYAYRVNNGESLTKIQIEKLKDKNLMIQYLIHLQIENAGERISIRELKEQRDNEEKIRQHTNSLYALNHNAGALNIGMEFGDRKRLEVKDNKEKQEFLIKINKRFKKLSQRLFGCDVEFGFYQRKDKNESRSVDYGFSRNGDIYFNFNNLFWDKYKTDREYKIIELVTHEFTHLVEQFIKGLGVDFELVINEGKSLKDLVGVGGNLRHLNKITFGSHQKDLDHEHSFEKIQRDILKLFTRERL